MPAKQGVKRKANGSQAAGVNVKPDLQAPDRNTWTGWVEMESDPAFFNVMLKDAGVRGVKVQELYSLESDMLAILPRPVHALIFLFKYRAQDEVTNGATTCPGNVWFANQIPDFACATVALINIVNNIPGIELGPELSDFRRSTLQMEHMARGDAIDKFDFVRRIHNSFASETEILNAEMHIRNKLLRPRQDVYKTNTADDRDDDDDQAGFHFIAYMPIDGHVWRMDGLDYYPQDLGAYGTDSAGGTGEWLDIAQSSLAVRMAQYQDVDSFNLMAVVHDSAMQDRLALVQNVIAIRAIDVALDAVVEDWREMDEATISKEVLTGPSDELEISSQDIIIAEVEHRWRESITNAADDLFKLLQLRQRIIELQGPLRAAVRDAVSAERRDQEEARHARHDYGSFVREWLGALAAEGLLSGLLEE
ncbi:cysteine proteinase [Dissoconium aciculare CBS 342.82]|uniref:Ubiquitin carboxyl-terminal hydrolase n=1 Tax=Dissoconium aciculare CBS 342.82 TaxID=1314786 RepID=A0A6J3ME49_9PEZI|nr:cysteine proteinase [Dissoconium aciculare CBS 342.82]KAF1825127.1 cysteine proteinase [Dissoconium aciculare CBS 342.82]